MNIAFVLSIILGVLRVHATAHVEGGIVGTFPVTLTVIHVRVNSVTAVR